MQISIPDHPAHLDGQQAFRCVPGSVLRVRDEGLVDNKASSSGQGEADHSSGNRLSVIEQRTSFPSSSS